VAKASATTLEGKDAGKDLACPYCFHGSAMAHPERCILCARNPSAGEFLRFLVVAVLFFLVLLVGRLMICGESFPGVLRFATLGGWERHTSFFYPVDLSLFRRQAVSIGLFFGALVSIPIITSVVFGAGYGAALAAGAYLAAVAPGVALVATLIAAVAGASWAPTRRPITRGAVACAAGSIAIAAYLYPGAAVRGRLGAFAYAPLTYAVGFSLLLSVGALALAKRRLWRAQSVIIAAGATFVVMAAVFETAVGTDVVANRLVYRSYSREDGLLAVTTTPEALRAPRVFTTPEERAKRRLESVLALLAYCERIKTTAMEGFAEVAQRFSGSSISPVCWYHSMHASSLIVDRPALVEEGLLRFREDLATRDWASHYQTICERHPESPISALAYLDLASIALGDTDFARAREYLVRLLNIFERQVPGDYLAAEGWTPAGVFDEFSRRGSFTEEERLFICDYAVRRGRRMLRFIEENADYDAEPVRIFCSLRPTDDAYVETIDGLLASAAYAESRLQDNLRLARMNATGGPRLKELLSLLDAFPSGDVVDEVLYQLARTYEEKEPTPENVERERHYLSRLVVEHHQSVRYPEACAMLSRLEK